MEKLRNIKHKYIIIEDNISNDLLSLTVPQIYRGPPGISVVRWLTELNIEYNVVPIFAGNAGKRIAKSIFDNIARKYL